MSGTSADPIEPPGESPAALLPAPLRWATDVLSGWAFPSFMLFTLTLAQVLLFVLMLTPPAESGFGAFAEAFKVWCFDYDPATGSIAWVYPAMLLLNPLMLDLILVGVWWVPLRDMLREHPRSLLKPAAVSVALISVLSALMFAFEPVRPTGELPFPAEVLRIHREPPQFTFTNHEGDPVSLESLRGRVVLVTAVYATCGYTCPMIMGQTKRVVAGLTPEEVADLTIVGITLDAERDTQEALAAMAAAQQVKAPLFNLVRGEPAKVEKVLDAFEVARSRNAETGMIDHANLFVLIDRDGKIAYRLTLGDQQERWLGTALRVLLKEREEQSLE